MPVYFTSMKVINKHSGNIVIKSSDKYPPKGYTIKPNNVAIITKKSSSNMPVTYSVFDVKTNKLVAVNQHSKVTIRPHLVRGQPVSLLVGGASKCTVLPTECFWKSYESSLVYPVLLQEKRKLN